MNSSTPSTGSDTGSRKGKYSLRFTLTVAFIGVALVSILVAALAANILAQSSVRHYFVQHMGPGPMMMGGPTPGGTLDKVNESFILSTVLALVLGLAMSLILARELSLPISGLTSAVHGIARGDYSRRVSPKGGREIQELGEAFNMLASGLETNEALRRNMVADVAHELRTPLASLKGQLEAIEDGVIDCGPSTITSLSEDVNILTRLVDDLQQLAKAEAGEMELERVEVDVAEALTSVAGRFAKEADEKGISIQVRLDESVPDASADPLRLAQVLSNLVNNALAHTPRGGRVMMGVRTAEEGMVELWVTDTGSGISAEDLPFIFERFYRAEPARDRARGGAGIGLAVARSLVEAHGGTISAASEPGRGTSISFTLPT